jgi:hypothetical protein
MRYCEHPGCTYHGDIDGMVRTPSREWYCLEHAPLFDHGGPITIGRRQRRGAEMTQALPTPEGGHGMTTPVVEIHVRGGVAYVVRKDANVRVTIRDFDNDPTGRETESYAATAVVQPEAHGQKRR